MKKEISEKTFELNITNELLNISKSFIWHLMDSPVANLLPKEVYINFLNESVFYAEGLTQEEEASPGGGYDVSININNPGLTEKRLLILQYKSGIRKKFHKKLIASQFHFSKKPDPFIEFTFNDAAGKEQHIILRKLANDHKIQKESVMYVFPRITEEKDFQSKIGNLIWNTSFVPVLEIDKQGLAAKPKVEIKPGSTHKFRTSYDGNKSEVNLLLLLLLLDYDRPAQILAELICVQIERFFRLAFRYFDYSGYMDGLLSYFSDGLKLMQEEVFGNINTKQLIFYLIKSYFDSVEKAIMLQKEIPSAPVRFTTVLPVDGIKLRVTEKIDLSNVSYQII